MGVIGSFLDEDEVRVDVNLVCSHRTRGGLNLQLLVRGVSFNFTVQQSDTLAVKIAKAKAAYISEKRAQEEPKTVTITVSAEKLARVRAYLDSLE